MKEDEGFIIKFSDWTKYYGAYSLYYEGQEKTIPKVQIERIDQINPKHTKPRDEENVKNARQKFIDKVYEKHHTDPNIKKGMVVKFPFLNEHKAEEYAKEYNENEDKILRLIERMREQENKDT